MKDLRNLGDEVAKEVAAMRGGRDMNLVSSEKRGFEELMILVRGRGREGGREGGEREGGREGKRVSTLCRSIL